MSCLPLIYPPIVSHRPLPPKTPSPCQSSRNLMYPLFAKPRHLAGKGPASVILLVSSTSNGDPMVTPLTRLIAGVSVPDSPLIPEVLEYAQKVSEPFSSITP